MPCENSARKRSKTMAFRCTPEEHKLICEMAAWSGMLRQDYIIAKLTDTQVEVKPSVSVQKALKNSMAELTKEVRLAASYGGLSESLQRRIELVMKFSWRSVSLLRHFPSTSRWNHRWQCQRRLTWILMGTRASSIWDAGRLNL